MGQNVRITTRDKINQFFRPVNQKNVYGDYELKCVRISKFSNLKSIFELKSKKLSLVCLPNALKSIIAKKQAGIAKDV